MGFQSRLSSPHQDSPLSRLASSDFWLSACDGLSYTLQTQEGVFENASMYELAL